MNTFIPFKPDGGKPFKFKFRMRGELLFARVPFNLYKEN